MSRTSNEIEKTNASVLARVWKPYEKFLFRIAFVFFILFSIPFAGAWWDEVLEINWFSLHYRDLYTVARFAPNMDLISFGKQRGGLYDYAAWWNLLIVALIVGTIWTFLDRKRANYEVLHYWLRVIVRYRAAIGIIGFGYTKLLPTQMPYPSLGLLNTLFGDFSAQKLYWLSVSIVPWYQVFGGVVELTAGVLLLFRRTSFLGATLLFGALGTIVFVNYAYNGGVHVYAMYFVVLGAFIMVQDLPVLYKLLIKEQKVKLEEYYPIFSATVTKYVRPTLKYATIFIFLIVFGYIMTINFIYDPYKQPSSKGVSELRGDYEVVDFKVNQELVLPSITDTLRWNNVSFERWSSLAFNLNKPVLLDLTNGGGSPTRDLNRTFEIAGVGGGKQVYYYEADTVNQILYLQNKVFKFDQEAFGKRRDKSEDTIKIADWVPESSRKHMTDEFERVHPLARNARREIGLARELRKKENRQKMVLAYQTENSGERVVLSGINADKDSLYIVLKRVERPVILSKSTLDAGKYD